jgi:hypothetical protein
MVSAFLGGVAVAVVCVLVSANDVYVAPTGTPDGDGSKGKPFDVFTALSTKSLAKPGDTIYLMAGTYDGKMNGIERVPFELAVCGAEGKPVRVMPVPGQSAHLNGSVSLTSSYAEYIGLDMGDLEWDPWQKSHKNPTELNSVSSANAKVLNCNIFGGAMGTGAWAPALNLEIYGCLIHDFGYVEERGGRGHGHCFYAQNKEGTKVFARNMAYRGCGWNVHVYTQGASIEGFDIIENICFLAGCGKPGQNMDNYLVAGYVPADRIRLLGNVGYQPRDIEKYRPNARLSAVLKAHVNGSGEVRDNYLIGAYRGLSLSEWQKLNVTGNTIWSSGVFMEITPGSGVPDPGEKPNLAGFTVDGNTYIANGKDKPFKYSSKEGEVDLLSLDEWRGLGLDKGSKVLPGRNGRPTGSKVFVFDNKYEKGRGNVAIFDWDGLDSVEVDLSNVLAKGQEYRLYNCLDIRTTISRAIPVLTGTFGDAQIAFPMRHDRISPHFDAFLVVPVAAQ